MTDNLNLYKDSNNLTSKELYKTRDNYKAYAFLDHTENYDPILYDSFQELPFYGKRDLFGNPIFVSEGYLKELRKKEKSMMLVHDFVRDAFNVLDAYYARGIAIGKLNNKTSPLSALRPMQAFSSIHSQYNSFLKKFNSSLVDFASSPENSKKIKTFVDYVRVFQDFLIISGSKALFSRSKFIESGQCDTFISGLSIALGTGEYENDQNKVKSFISDSNYPFFLEACKRHCFFVDRAAPWVISFDFNSPEAQKYYTRYKLVDEQDVYNKRYYKAFYSDLNIIKDFLIFSYTSFVSTNKKQDIVLDISKCGTVQLTNISREKPLNKALKAIKDIDWLVLYFDMRVMEEGISLPISKRKNILVDVENILMYGTYGGDLQKEASAINFLNTNINSLKTQVESTTRF